MTEFVSLAALPPLVALIAAAVLAFVPAWRIASWINVGASVATLAAACVLVRAAPAPGLFTLADPFAIHLVLLTSFVGMTTSFVSVGYVRAEVALGRLNAPRLRIYHALYQAFMGFMLLALLSNNFGVTWMAIEAATIAAVVAVALPGTCDAIAASWKCLIICGVGISLALFGTVVLYLAALPALGPGLPAMSWDALFVAAPRCRGSLLNLAFVFLLIGYGTKAALAPMHIWMPDAHAEGPTPISAVLAGSMMNVALFVILRLRKLLAVNAGAIAPGPPIIALGLLSLLIAAFSLWRRHDVKHFFAFASIGQSGVAAYTFGLGGSAAIFTGALHMTFHTLVRSAILQCVGWIAQIKAGQTFADVRGLLATHRALGLTLAAGIIALAGLPPFGLFSTEIMIAAQTMRRSPWLFAPLGLGLVVVAWAMLAGLQALCLGPRSPDRQPAPAPLGAVDLVPACLHLAIVLVLGLAMPSAVVAWFAAIAASAG